MTDTAATTVDTRPLDAKGRVAPEHMTDRELLVELTTNMRQIADAVDDLSTSPMVQAMMQGANPLTAMFGR